MEPPAGMRKAILPWTTDPDPSFWLAGMRVACKFGWRMVDSMTFEEIISSFANSDIVPVEAIVPCALGALDSSRRHRVPSPGCRRARFKPQARVIRSKAAHDGPLAQW